MRVFKHGALWRTLVFLALALCALTRADGIDSFLSVSEFNRLAREVAPKVNLFRDVWSQDPEAEFFGGTSRDFLYWLKGKFKGVTNRAEAEAVIAKLRATEVVDIREFINSGSDIDVLANKSFTVDADHYGVAKIDVINKERLDPTTEAGKTERNRTFAKPRAAAGRPSRSSQA